ncbi:phosphoribosyltransferase [Actinomadura chokoriensis]|uniref:phosphoribosyltransferase n=1 Tax=Actinomadura chokoriensis TaxID=454156 RepID=UPI0031F8F4B6
MLDRATENHLRTALVTSAGGFLRNPVRRPRTTCAVCTTPIDDRYSFCYVCKRHRLHKGTADIVAPMIYAVPQQQSGYVMRGYKARPPVGAHLRLVTMLTLFTLSRHGACAGTGAGIGLTHWAAVPSLPAKPGEHPLHRIVRGSAPGTEVRLAAAPRTSDPRALDAAHFTADARLPRGSHVLLLDDTWTSGGHAQSAALSLREAGASTISVLVVARWIKPEFGNNAKFLDGLPDFDPDICPWTGDACPR